jgi:hypothetical protein
MKPRNETGALLHAPVPKLQLTGAYQFPPSLQPLSNGTNGEVKFRDPFHQEDIRCCVACSVLVDNSNVGGYDGRNAMTGKFWCYSCADGFPPSLRPPGGLR